MLKPGNVIILYSGRNAKDRMHVIVSVGQGWFFRINTKAHWPGSFPIAKSENQFLKHDSHIECGGLVDVDISAIEISMNERGLIGTLSKKTIAELVNHISSVRQLDAEQKRIIIAELNNSLK